MELYCNAVPAAESVLLLAQLFQYQLGWALGSLLEELSSSVRLGMCLARLQR